VPTRSEESVRARVVRTSRRLIALERESAKGPNLDGHCTLLFMDIQAERPTMRIAAMLKPRIADQLVHPARESDRSVSAELRRAAGATSPARNCRPRTGRPGGTGHDEIGRKEHPHAPRRDLEAFRRPPPRSRYAFRLWAWPGLCQVLHSVRRDSARSRKRALRRASTRSDSERRSWVTTTCCGRHLQSWSSRRSRFWTSRARSCGVFKAYLSSIERSDHPRSRMRSPSSPPAMR
jgi:hypothetical protein